MKNETMAKAVIILMSVIAVALILTPSNKYPKIDNSKYVSEVITVNGCWFVVVTQKHWREEATIPLHHPACPNHKQ